MYHQLTSVRAVRREFEPEPIRLAEMRGRYTAELPEGCGGKSCDDGIPARPPTKQDELAAISERGFLPKDLSNHLPGFDEWRGGKVDETSRGVGRMLNHDEMMSLRRARKLAYVRHYHQRQTGIKDFRDFWADRLSRVYGVDPAKLGKIRRGSRAVAKLGGPNPGRDVFPSAAVAALVYGMSADWVNELARVGKRFAYVDSSLLPGPSVEARVA